MSIQRDAIRDDIAKMLAEYFLADSFDEQVALTDMIMDRIASIPLTQLTVSKIMETIEMEVVIWLKMKEGQQCWKLQ